MLSKALFLLIGFNFIITTKTVEVCFKPYGCYSLDSPWWTISRPFAVLPKPPEEINTRFLLFTRDEPQETELVTNKTGILDLSDFDNSKNTKVIVHGFLHSVNEKWVSKMKTELLLNEDCNLLVVEWGDGAGIPYMQACANARVVGDQISHMLRFLEREADMDLKTVHIIGQGLGSHVAGYAGKKTKISRISALDPPQPYFWGSEAKIRLAKTDADFVDVIHTDGSSLLTLGFGIDSPVGHVDFYANNGKNQPGCGDLLDRITGSFWDVMRLNLIGVREGLACSHRRATDLFIESINTKCPFIAFPCDNEKNFQEGKCGYCSHGKCSRIGYHSDKFSGRGKMYLTTNGGSPFCHYSFVANLTTSQNQKATTGEIYVQALGRSGRTDFARINNISLNVRSRTTYSTALQAVVEMSEVTGIKLKFVDKTPLFKKELIVDKIIITKLDSNLQPQSVYFCVTNTIIKHGATIDLKPSTNSC